MCDLNAQNRLRETLEMSTTKKEDRQFGDGVRSGGGWDELVVVAETGVSS